MRRRLLVLTLILVSGGCAPLKAFEQAEELSPQEREWRLREQLLHHPDDVKALEALAEWMIGRLDRMEVAALEAETAVRALLKRSPEHAAAHGWLGLALRAQDRAAEAEAAFQRELELDPDRWEVAMRYANVMATHDRLDVALDVARSVAGKHPASSNMHAFVAYLLIGEGRFQEAEDAFLPLAKANAQAFAKRDLVLGELLLRNETLEKSETHLRRFQTRHPTDGEGLSLLVQVLERQKKYGEAEPFARLLVRGASDARSRAAALMRLGDNLFWQKRLPEADLIYVDAAETEPSDEEHVRAVMAHLVGRDQTHLFERLLKGMRESGDPHPGRWYVVAGEVYLLDGRLEAAERAFRQAIAESPGYGPGYLHLALVLADRSDLIGIERLFGAVQQRVPEDAREFYAKLAYQTAQNPEINALTLTLFQHALVQDPASANLLMLAGNWMADNQYGNEAKPLLVRRLDREPDDTDTWLRLAEVQKGLGEDAESSYRRVLTKNPFQLSAVIGLMGEYRDSGRFDEAMALLVPLQEGEPDNWAWPYRRLILLHEARRFSEEEHLAKALLDEYPDNVLLVHQWAIVQGKLQRWTEAEAAFRRALTLDNPDFDPMVVMAVIKNNLAYALAMCGRHQEVERLYRDAMQNEPRMGRIPYHFGQWLKERGRLQEAETLLKQAKEMDPTLEDEEDDRFMTLVLE